MSLVEGTVTISSLLGDSTVTVIPGPIQVVSIGAQGPAGPPGSGSAVTAQCGVNIAAGIACVLVGGLLYPADPTNVTLAGLYVGISTEAGLTGHLITVNQLGQLNTTGLTVGSRYFVGLLGVLSTTPLAVGSTWMRYIGTAQSSTSLILVSSISIVLG
jgi:hypothetical protein